MRQREDQRGTTGSTRACRRGRLLVRVDVGHYLRMDADKQSCSLGVDSDYVELAVELFGMLADATRVRIILALRDEELSVNLLADIVDKPPATVSQHLAKLRLARIVLTRHQGTRVFYRLANEHVRQIVADAVFQAEHSLADTPRHHQLEMRSRP